MLILTFLTVSFSSLFSVEEYETEKAEEPIDKTQPINPSQITLVGQGVNEPSAGESPIGARQHRDQQMIPTEGALINEPEESQEHIGSTSNAQPQLPIPPVTPTTYQGKRKRGQKAQVPRRDAPYRNTRARSGSVGQPVATDSTRPVRRGPNKKAIEATQNEELTDQGRPESALIPETIAEEADVEQLLIAESNGEGLRTPSSHPQQQLSWSATQILQTLGMVEDAEGQTHRRPTSSSPSHLKTNDVSEEAEGQGYPTPSRRSPQQLQWSAMKILQTLEEAEHPNSPGSSQQHLTTDVSEEAEGQGYRGRTDLNTPGGRSPQRLQWSATQLLQSLNMEDEVEKVEEKPLPTLETDDEQIDRKLSGPQSRQTKVEYNDPDPLKILKEFNDRTPSNLYLSPTPMGSPSSRAQRPSLLPVAERDADGDARREALAQGTRARVTKKRGEEKRKQEEYVPPPNTRAARFARRQ